jgi:HlyD family secretion protein
MNIARKIAVGAFLILLLGAIVGFTVRRSEGSALAVETGKVERKDLAAVVSASGEIQPKTYVNLGASAFGKITRLYVKEGDKVRRGQVLVQLENIQSGAELKATRASLKAAETDARAAQAALDTAKAELSRAKADSERAQLDWNRTQVLYDEAVIAKAERDRQKDVWLAAQAGVVQAEAHVVEAGAQEESAERRVDESRANLTRAADTMDKTVYEAPFDGIVTNMPVREGETVVIGIQNSPGSTLMTVADPSVITAQVLVDEADIGNVRPGQSAEVSIDAIPRKTFKAVVTGVGENAIIRSTGISTAQQGALSQDAKDFRVELTLQPPPDVRPGLSVTARIVTAVRRNAMSIPIQALTLRRPADLEGKTHETNSVPTASGSELFGDHSKDDIQGVFVVHSGKAQFVHVKTGIESSSDVEVLEGLDEHDEIVTGSYLALRTLTPGTKVKTDDSDHRSVTR